MKFELLLVALFSSWAAASLLVLLPKRRYWIRSHDLFGVVPEWRFFAPNPAQHDYHLLYRDHFADGSLTGWTEISPKERRRWWNFLFNSVKRDRKALFDIIQELSKRAQELPQGIETSIAYISLLYYVSNIPRTTSPDLTQFLLLQSKKTGGTSELDVVYLSKPHNL